MTKLILFNKPFGVITQFSPHEKHKSLAEFIPIKEMYPAGRLDHDSEGLLLLTDDGKLQDQITNPKNKMPKTYLAQVDNEITEEAISQLRLGVLLKDGKTLPADCKRIDEPKLWERDPPVRFRKSIPTSWIELTIREGKNRQVRRMTAAVGFPTLRLVRVKVGPYELAELPVGSFSELEV
jgi:23S rRNA pseudouridine2457 synthase